MARSNEMKYMGMNMSAVEQRSASRSPQRATFNPKGDIAEMSSLPKPVLRGHMKKKGMMALFGAIAFAAVNCSLLELLYILPKKKRYEDFYLNYNSKAHTLELIRWGYFQTIRPQDIRRKGR